MTGASISMNGLTSAKSWARPHDAARRPIELNDNYYRVPAAGGVNSNIKEMSLWMLAQMGAMPDVLSPQVLNTVHAPLVKTPGERGRLRKFLERSIHLPTITDERHALLEIQSAAAGAFGASGASIGLAVPGRAVLRYVNRGGDWVEYPDDMFIAGQVF